MGYLPHLYELEAGIKEMNNKRTIGRKKQSEAMATKISILTTSFRLFSERGLDGTSLRQIASDIGVTHATITHHFGSKKQLYQACIQYYSELYCEKIHSIPVLAKNQSNHIEEYDYMIRSLVDTVFGYSCLFRVLSALSLDDFLEYRVVIKNIDVAHEQLLPIFQSTSEHIKIPFKLFLSLLIGRASNLLVLGDLKIDNHKLYSANDSEYKKEILDSFLFRLT